MKHVCTITAVTILLALSACKSSEPAPATPVIASEPESDRADSSNVDEREQRLAEAKLLLDQDPSNIPNIIWYGRRLAYLERFDEAIAEFSRGLEIDPNSYRLLRHRGHRYISTRQFDKAIADLNRAAELIKGMPIEIEPDGQPNPAGVPRSNTQFNIYYHLGLAHYLKGDLKQALAAYWLSEAFSKNADKTRNDDLLCATWHWTYMTLRRVREHDEAEDLVANFPANPELLENHAYHALIQLYCDERDVDAMLTAIDMNNMTVEDVTIGYGLVNWLMCEDRADDARALRDAILRSPHKYAFGYIAAETDARFAR